MDKFIPYHNYEPPILTEEQQKIHDEIINGNNREVLLHALHTLQTLDTSILDRIIR